MSVRRRTVRRFYYRRLRLVRDGRFRNSGKLAIDRLEERRSVDRLEEDGVAVDFRAEIAVVAHEDDGEIATLPPAHPRQGKAVRLADRHDEIGQEEVDLHVRVE